MLSHISSFSVLLAIVMFRHEAVPHGTLLGWGLLAGFCGGFSLSSFYVALSRGAMGAAAAVSGLLAAAIPATVSMCLEGRPTAMRLVGFGLAAASIWLIAAGPKAAGAQRSTMVLAMIAGVGFGVYFVALRFANPLGVFMPMALARAGSLVTCALAFTWLMAKDNAKGQMNRSAVLWALGAGALDTSGNLLFIASTRAGRLDVAAVLASLYPASTMALAAWLLKERLQQRQWIGMAVALLSVVMITV